MMSSEVPVLIVGGGPVGLSCSLALSRFGVPSLLVERHPGTSIHPRARGLNVRTMELLRTWGLEDAVRAAGRALENARYILWAESLAGRELNRVEMPSHRAFLDSTLSPTSYVACAQNDLEPVLVAHGQSFRGLSFATTTNSCRSNRRRRASRPWCAIDQPELRCHSEPRT